MDAVSYAWPTDNTELVWVDVYPMSLSVCRIIIYHQSVQYYAVIVDSFSQRE